MKGPRRNLWTLLEFQDAIDELKGDIQEASLGLKNTPWSIMESLLFFLQVIEKCTGDLASGKALVSPKAGKIT